MAPPPSEPPPRLARPEFWRTAGIALLVAAFPFSIAIAALLSLLIESRWPDAVPASALAWGVFGALGSPMLIGGIRMINRSRQLRAAHAPVVSAPDTRPPVLYLRAFDADARLAAPPPLAQINPFVISTGEENLIEALQGIGPVIAIGRPGEPLPPLGAQRIYVGDDAWQAKVLDLMAQARLVVLMIGTGEGLWWEIEQALTRLPPPQVVFIGAARDFRAFVERARAWLPDDARPPRPRRMSLDPSDYLLHFTPAGQARFTRLRNPAMMLRGNLRKPMLPVYQVALRPVFEQLGMAWSPPPIPWKVILINAGLLLLLFGGIALLAWFDPGQAGQ